MLWPAIEFVKITFLLNPGGIKVQTGGAGLKSQACLFQYTIQVIPGAVLNYWIPRPFRAQGSRLSTVRSIAEHTCSVP